MEEWKALVVFISYPYPEKPELEHVSDLSCVCHARYNIVKMDIIRAFAHWFPVIPITVISVVTSVVVKFLNICTSFEWICDALHNEMNVRWEWADKETDWWNVGGVSKSDTAIFGNCRLQVVISTLYHNNAKTKHIPWCLPTYLFVWDSIYSTCI